MSSTITPNMSLLVPTVGNQPGPNFAQNLDDDLSIIDSHDHTSGRGVQITTAGININSSFTLNNNLMNNIAGLTLTAQSVTPGVSTIYESGNDMYFVDGLGNNVRITQSGGVAGSPGSISNLTSPASASYVAGSQTFVWQSGASIAANLDAGALLLRNITPNSTNAITLQPPASLSSSYNITLPALPGSTLFLTMNSSGTIGTASSILATQIAGNTITGAQLTTNAGIVGTQLASNTITGTQIQNNVTLPGKTASMNGQRLIVSQTNAVSSGLGIVRATFNAVGVLIKGEGATATSFGTGNYSVSFASPFSDPPVVVANTNDTNFFVVAITATSTTGCSINIYNTVSGSGNDAAFSIIAIGQT